MINFIEIIEFYKINHFDEHTAPMEVLSGKNESTMKEK